MHVDALALIGSVETKNILAIYFQHASDDTLSSDDIHQLTQASVAEWAQDMSEDHVPADTLMLMAMCDILNIDGFDIYTDVPGFEQIIHGLDKARPPSLKMIPLAYFNLEDEVRFHRSFKFSKI